MLATLAHLRNKKNFWIFYFYHNFMVILPSALNAVLSLNSNSLIQIMFGLVKESVLFYLQYISKKFLFLCIFLMIYLRIDFPSPKERNKLPRKWLLKLFQYASKITLTIVHYQDEFTGLNVYLYRMVHFPRKGILRNFNVCHFWTNSLSGSYHQAENKFLTCWSCIHGCNKIEIKMNH